MLLLSSIQQATHGVLSSVHHPVKGRGAPVPSPDHPWLKEYKGTTLHWRGMHIREGIAEDLFSNRGLGKGWGWGLA